MKATGIVRKIDELGRIVLPKELRDLNEFDEGTALEIYVDDGGKIILQKYERGCSICNRTTPSDGVKINNRIICGDCKRKIAGS